MKHIKFKGTDLELEGNEIKVGQQAPDCKLINSALQEVSISDFKGKPCLLNIVPSLDTPVCMKQSKEFYHSLSSLPCQLVTISMDLPFAQARFCGAENLTMTTLSDHKEASFGKHYGCLIKPLRLLARAVIVLDADQKICYCEIVEEMTSEPNYKAAMDALDSLIKAQV